MAKIISIHSYRGGTGKSNLTANIASIVASQGNRVGIVDTDIQSPGVHILFGVNEKKLEYTLNDFLWGQCPIEKVACDVTHVLQENAHKDSKIYLLPSSMKINDISRILREGFDIELLFDGFQSLVDKLKLDYLFIDTHPGLNEETLLSLTFSDIVFVVLRPDKQDFQGTAVTVEVAQKLKVPQIFLIINKALAAYNFMKMSEQIESTYGLPVVGILPESKDVIRLASNGIFSLKYEDHPITETIKEIAKTVMIK
ncbi:MinD/ParA family protein [Cyanobacterium aponinum UTEX 3222]|nr:MinD/ParA family protein [Cyanobacterium aponinum]WRL41252.1 MinD/ParA family protein [Cyanobacterium aponinum UTEX 3222]MBD2395222.1 MinD/ParA family protein [Cyanobacterium aponinum FACHB-4101]MTF40238.1 AAA family ATPase [Cyanobacterium aponinum 0216]WPF89655.1 MinD/ParA family protein [Cyanobacterium aponinum AL20115]WRL38262.1 MinD/ParA family protein [Cyanobacterium aponinum UTEX 3221]